VFRNLKDNLALENTGTPKKVAWSNKEVKGGAMKRREPIACSARSIQKLSRWRIQAECE